MNLVWLMLGFYNSENQHKLIYVFCIWVSCIVGNLNYELHTEMLTARNKYSKFNKRKMEGEPVCSNGLS